MITALSLGLGVGDKCWPKPRNNTGLWCKKIVANSFHQIGWSTKSAHDTLEEPWGKAREPEGDGEELSGFAPFSTAGTMKHLENNVIIVKGRLSLGTGTMYTDTPGHARPQRTKKNRLHCRLCRLVGLGVQSTPFLRDQFSIHSLPWVSVPLTPLTLYSYFCLALSSSPPPLSPFQIESLRLHTTCTWDSGAVEPAEKRIPVRAASRPPR